jgi:hypothetical protein
MKHPAIEQFIVNVIDTNHGIQVPALLHNIVETFNRDGVSQSIFSDKDLLNWINSQLMSKTKRTETTPTDIGRGVGTHVDYSGGNDSNKDPFVLLVPDKGMF